MPSNNESQCYFVQLQIDGYLDGELNEAQQVAFVMHVQQCTECASEFRYAQTLQDALIELPQVECSDTVLAPVHKTIGDSSGKYQTTDANEQSLVARLGGFLQATPLFFRYGLSAAAIAVVAVVLTSSMLTEVESPPQVVVSESGEVYSAEDIVDALQELDVALDYLNQLSQRTEVMIGDRFLVSPLQDSINASFEKAGISERDPLQNGPI